MISFILSRTKLFNDACFGQLMVLWSDAGFIWTTHHWFWFNRIHCEHLKKRLQLFSLQVIYSYSCLERREYKHFHSPVCFIRLIWRKYFISLIWNVNTWLNYLNKTEWKLTEPKVSQRFSMKTFLFLIELNIFGFINTLVIWIGKSGNNQMV